eukprot:GHVU01005182.1.p1 GENE.GHVU01005182.1~~GHVU01005182.1.p1  ORF type:complete len:159 (-),score=12.86 GHVU01005182.1:499-975(-)
MNLDDLLSNAPLGLRIFTAITSALYAFAATIALFFYGYNYSRILLCLLAISMGCVGLVSEFSPLGLNILLSAFPFFGDYRGRGASYMLAGLFTLGHEMGVFCQVAGSLVLFSGVFTIAMYYYGPILPSEIGYEGAAVPSGFDRYEGAEPAQYDEFPPA